MANSFTYQSNTKEAWRKLQNAERKALRAVGKELRDELRKTVPVVTGNLKKSIRHRVNGKKMQLRVGSLAPHSKFLELGTSKMKPHPFLFKTINANRGKAKERFAEIMKELNAP